MSLAFRLQLQQAFGHSLPLMLEHSSLSLVEQTLSIFPSTTIHYEVSYYYLAPHSVQLSQPNHHAMHNIWSPSVNNHRVSHSPRATLSFFLLFGHVHSTQLVISSRSRVWMYMAHGNCDPLCPLFSSPLFFCSVVDRFFFTSRVHLIN